MFLTGADATADVHLAPQRVQHPPQTVLACQRQGALMHRLPGDLGSFDQAAIGLVPTAQQQHPVLHQHRQQFRKHFTGTGPRLGRPPLVNAPAAAPPLPAS